MNTTSLEDLTEEELREQLKLGILADGKQGNYYFSVFLLGRLIDHAPKDLLIHIIREVPTNAEKA